MYFAKIEIVRFVLFFYFFFMGKKRMSRTHEALRLMLLIWPNRMVNSQCNRAYISLTESGTRIVFANTVIEI